MSICVWAATQKKFEAELADYIIPIEVGAALLSNHTGYQRDDNGDNISKKNQSFCELTAFYWGWKNSESKIKGICHYRRYFGRIDKATPFELFLTSEKKLKEEVLPQNEIEEYLQEYDVILPIPLGPSPKTVRENLETCVYKEDIITFEQVLQENAPEYLDDWNEIMKGTHASYCNMMISKSDVFDSFCQWMFQLLFEAEKKICLIGYDEIHRRIYGYISEILLNVWIKHKDLRVKYMGILFLNDATHIFNNLKNTLFREIQRLYGRGTFVKVYDAYLSRRFPERYRAYVECKKLMNMTNGH